MDALGYLAAWIILLVGTGLSLFLRKRRLAVILPLGLFSGSLFLTLRYFYDIIILPHNPNNDGIPITDTMRLFLMDDNPFVTPIRRGAMYALLLTAAAAVCLILFCCKRPQNHSEASTRFSFIRRAR